jgi:parallel beta-helix repeat protein
VFAAIYLDDQLSGQTIVGNTFIDCQKGAFIGGGRDNVVEGNTFINTDYAVHIDDRGLNWQLADCTYNSTNTGFLVQQLFQYNYTQPPYAVEYPSIVNTLTTFTCDPFNNTVVSNAYCGCSQGFIDVTANQTDTWKDLVANNTEFTSC